MRPAKELQTEHEEGMLIPGHTSHCSVADWVPLRGDRAKEHHRKLLWWGATFLLARADPAAGMEEWWEGK